MLTWTHMVLAFAFDFQIAQFWIDLGSVLLTVILTIPTILPKKRSKLLSYRILSDAALIDERKDLGEDDIQIKIDGNEVTDVRLIMMQVMNNGAQAIRSDEYEYDNESKIHFEFKPLLNTQSKDTKQVTQNQYSPQPSQLTQSLLILCAMHATKPEGIMSKGQQKRPFQTSRAPHQVSSTPFAPIWEPLVMLT